MKVKISDPHDSGEEEEPRRKPGPKSRRPLTPQKKESLEENSKRSTRKGKCGQENVTPARNGVSSDDEEDRPATPQPRMSDSEEEAVERSSRRKNKDCVRRRDQKMKRRMDKNNMNTKIKSIERNKKERKGKKR